MAYHRVAAGHAGVLSGLWAITAWSSTRASLQTWVSPHTRAVVEHPDVAEYSGAAVHVGVAKHSGFAENAGLAGDVGVAERLCLARYVGFLEDPCVIVDLGLAVVV